MVIIQQLVVGLSPRGRGKPARRRQPGHGQWSIPAWAGETFPGLYPGAAPGVYPRVGGGNYESGATEGGANGLSPRGRGKPRTHKPGRDTAGSIPAWAGETVGGLKSLIAEGVYPRVGGGNDRGFHRDVLAEGLSPRGRGKPDPDIIMEDGLRSIPAWAGETADRTRSSKAARVYPRVGGGNAAITASQSKQSGLSPRGRGKPRHCPLWRCVEGSIPAWAGETEGYPAKRQNAEVYPRVGGGNPWANRHKKPGRGLSPRGRGKRDIGPQVKVGNGSIPAWAGETTAPQRFPGTPRVYPRVGGGNSSIGGNTSSCTGLSPRGRGKLSQAFSYRI